MMAQSVYEQFAQTAHKNSARPFLNITEATAAAYGIDAGEITYGEILTAVDARAGEFQKAGYGKGHRVGLLLENRPSYFVNWFALNSLGVSVVPINPDLRSAELEYLIGHSDQCLAIAIEPRIRELQEAVNGLKVIAPEEEAPPAPSEPGPDDFQEAALLYTSGTTGMPKGCMLSNSYFLKCGDGYSTVGGHCTLHRDGERMLTPLPLFHMNAMACSVMGMIAVGGCLTVLDRFHPSTWWQDVASSKASIIHYLGVMPAILMQLETLPAERGHNVRFGFGAGVDRALHAPFEERFGFPLIEAWAMTETGNGAVIAASSEPRYVGTNCIGKPSADVEIKIVDERGKPASLGTPGELLVRRSGANPRYGFFDGYLKDEEATEEAWRGGWFHTGDVVRKNQDGTLVFVDRKKNVIRRSGENISAVEVETVLMQHPDVAAAAVAAVADELRGDEVFACIVPAEEVETGKLADGLFRWCRERLAYYKAPGFFAFVEELPLTSTNKINRGALKSLVTELNNEGAAIDLRQFKKRVVA
ncbi:MAG: AMP-binding protein [Hyphomicrobiales bacterium]